MSNKKYSVNGSRCVSVKVFRDNSLVMSLATYDDSDDLSEVRYNALGSTAEDVVRSALRDMRQVVTARQVEEMLDKNFPGVVRCVYRLPHNTFDHETFFDLLCASSATKRFVSPGIITLSRTPDLVRSIADDMLIIGDDIDKPAQYLKSMCAAVSQYHSAAAALYRGAESASCALQAAIVMQEIQKGGL